MEIKTQERQEAVDRYVSLVGLSKSQAEALVDAALQAAIDQTLDAISGGGPIASSMTAYRADQLRFVCLRAARILSQREVEILFRITAAQARAVLTSMYATYETALLAQFRAQMQDDCEVSPSGSEQSGLTWILKFTESSTFQFAVKELDRLGLDRFASTNVAQRTVELPQSVELHGQQLDPLKDLGIKASATGKRE